MVHLELSNELISKGFECYLVGGCVRDYFMNEQSLDYDLVTNARPEEISDIFRGRKVSNVGETFKVSIVDGIEIATFRKDIYFGNSDKNCCIEYADCIEEDLARRDLTINSIAKCLKTNRIIDPFHGINDLICQRIRFVGNPNDRIREDPNRMIRTARFFARLANKSNIYNVPVIAEETSEAIINNLNLFQYIAKERIRLEIMKAMKIKKASYFFIALHNLQMLKLIFPSMEKCWGLDGGNHHPENVFEHLMFAGDYLSTRCEVLKLTGYLHDVGKAKAYDPVERTFIGHETFGEHIVEKDLKNLKFSNDEIQTIKKYVRFHMRNTHGKDKSIKKLLREFNENGLNYRAHTRLKCADRAANLNKPNFSFSEIKNILGTYEKFFRTDEKPSVLSIKDLDINGNDLIEYFDIKPGKIVGDMLKFLLEEVYDEKVNNEKTDLLKHVLENFGEFK